MEHTTNLMLSLLRTALTGEALPADLPDGLDEAALEELYTLSKAHELTPLVASALNQTQLPPAWKAKLKKQLFAALYSDETKVRALAQLQTAFDGAGIDYIPLKGSVLRDCYPEPWMRTRCDIDLLVREEDLQRACETLEGLDHRPGERSTHDVSYHTPGGVHLELHYRLHSDAELIRLELLEQVWDYAVPAGDGRRYLLTDPMFYLYHVAHMAKHVRNGGCGVRPFMDLWLLDGQETADREGRTRLVAQCGLTTFAETASRLAEGWFGTDRSALSAPLCVRLANYTLGAGVYGNEENRLANWGEEAGGFLLRRVVKPYDQMKRIYPALEKRPWMLPAYQVVRWRDILRGSHFKAGMHNWHAMKEITPDQHAQVKHLMQGLEIWEK